MRKYIDFFIEKYKKIPLTAKVSLWVAFCSFMQKGITLLTTPIFTRLMSSVEYGSFTTIGTWEGVVAVFVTLSLSGGVYTQGLVKFEEKRDELSSSVQGLLLTLCSVWTVIYFVFSGFWNNIFGTTTAQGLIMLGTIWTSAVFSLWTAEQRVKLNYRVLVILTVIASVLKPVVGIIAVTHSQDKVTARLLGLLVVEFVVYGGCFIDQMRRGKVFFSKFFWKYSLAMAIPLIPHYLSQIILNTSDRIMIKSMVGASEAAYYSIAYSVGQLVNLLTTSLLASLTPWMYSRIKKKEYGKIAGNTYLSVLGVAIVDLIVICLAPELVRILAPAEYSDAVWVIPPIAMGTMFSFSYNLFATFEFYYEKTALISVSSIIGAALNILLNYLLIPKFGYYAAGYTTLVCYILYACAHYCSMRWICKTKLDNVKVYDSRKIFFELFAFCAVGCAFSLTYNYTVVRYALILGLVILIVCGRKKIKAVLASLKQ